MAGRYDYRKQNLEKEVEHIVKTPVNLLEHIALGRHSKLIQWSLVVLFMAVVGLFFVKQAAIGSIFSVDTVQVLNIAIQLFAIINPMSVLPTFLVYTEGLAAGDRRKIANTTAIIVVTLIATFALFGQLILNSLQITLDSFKFGGGILLLVLAIDMLGGTARTKTVDTQQVAIVPLATPLLVGPGTMTTLIVLTNTQNLVNVMLGGLVAAMAVFLILRFSQGIVRVVGKNGLLALSRLMSIILAAVAANMLHGALKAWDIAK